MWHPRTPASHHGHSIHAPRPPAALTAYGAPQVTCRHAAAATLYSLLQRDDKSNAVKARVVEANGIPALLSALQDTHPR
jgi:hypothetical protein